MHLRLGLQRNMVLSVVDSHLSRSPKGRGRIMFPVERVTQRRSLSQRFQCRIKVTGLSQHTSRAQCSRFRYGDGEGRGIGIKSYSLQYPVPEASRAGNDMRGPAESRIPRPFQGREGLETTLILQLYGRSTPNIRWQSTESATTVYIQSSRS